MSAHERPRVLVAVATYRRSELLPALVRAIRGDAARTDASVRVLVVDNNPDAAAAGVAASLGALHLPEPRPGIAAARQAALEAADDDELLVMIDDDLLPEPGWLAALIDTWHAHRAAAVMGYVRYVWPEGTDPWVAAGGFLRRDRHPTGQRLSGLSTGNVLLDVAQLRSLGVGFDTSLGLSGGSDLQLGRELVAAGGTIVACAESVARDDIAPERTTRAFVRRRAIAQGEARVRLLTRDRDGARPLSRRAGHLVGGLTRVPAFALAECWAMLRGDVPASASLRRRRWFAQGRVRGAVGRYAPEYSRDAAQPSAAH